MQSIRNVSVLSNIVAYFRSGNWRRMSRIGCKLLAKHRIGHYEKGERKEQRISALKA